MSYLELFSKQAIYFLQYNILITYFSFEDSKKNIRYRIYFKDMVSGQVVNPLIDKSYHSSETLKEALEFIFDLIEEYLKKENVKRN